MISARIPDRPQVRRPEDQSAAGRPGHSHLAHWGDTSGRSGDLCFITAAPPDEVVGHLHDLGIAIVQGPVERAGALGPIQSVYCHDPDGNLVEISSYQSE